MIRVLLTSAAAVMIYTTAFAADAGTPKPAIGNADADKIICRKTLETGSLVRKKKECYTRAEWDKIYAAHREGNTKTRDQLSSGFNCQATGSC